MYIYIYMCVCVCLSVCCSGVVNPFTLTNSWHSVIGL